MEGGSGVSYDVSHNVLFITPYEYAGLRYAALLRSGERGVCNGKSEYNSILFEYFTAHQLMHLVYDETGINAANHWDEEMHINAMTWLFLKRTGLAQGRDALLGSARFRPGGPPRGPATPDAATDTHFAQSLEVTNNATTGM